MKTNKLKYVWFVLILSIFCLALFLARGRTKIEMRNRIYSQWSQQFLVTKGGQSYVRTTNDSEETTVLIRGPKLRHAHNGFSSPKRSSKSSRF